MLTDFPYWQYGGSGLLWPECDTCYGLHFWGGSLWPWSYCTPPTGYTCRITATNPNPYTMRVYWKKFTSPISGPTTSGETGPDAEGYYMSEIPPGSSKIYTCTSPSGGYDSTVGKIGILLPGGEVLLGETEGEYDCT